MAKAIRSRINGNPCRKQKIIVSDIKLALRTIFRILGKDLKLKAYKRYTGHLLILRLKGLKVEKAAARVRQTLVQKNLVHRRFFWRGITSIHFCTPGVKISKKLFSNRTSSQRDSLADEDWFFQQDYVPAHKSKRC